jgi:large subunit ribosomal protein L35
MPKTKTRRSAHKRFKISATGKLLHRAVGMGHLRSKKSSRRKRRLMRDFELTGGYKRQMMKCLPHAA